MAGSRTATATSALPIVIPPAPSSVVPEAGATGPGAPPPLDPGAAAATGPPGSGPPTAALSPPTDGFATVLHDEVARTAPAEGQQKSIAPKQAARRGHDEKATPKPLGAVAAATTADPLAITVAPTALPGPAAPPGNPRATHPPWPVSQIRRERLSPRRVRPRLPRPPRRRHWPRPLPQPGPSHPLRHPPPAGRTVPAPSTTTRATRRRPRRPCRRSSGSRVR